MSPKITSTNNKVASKKISPSANSFRCLSPVLSFLLIKELLINTVLYNPLIVMASKSNSWLSSLQSTSLDSSPEAPSRTRSGQKTPSVSSFPRQSHRASATREDQGSIPGTDNSVPIDPVLLDLDETRFDNNPTPTRLPSCPSVGGKQPKQHILEQQDGSSSPVEAETDDDVSEEEQDYAKERQIDSDERAALRRFARVEGEKLKLTDQSIQKAKRFAVVCSNQLS